MRMICTTARYVHLIIKLYDIMIFINALLLFTMRDFSAFATWQILISIAVRAYKLRLYNIRLTFRDIYR